MSEHVDVGAEGDTADDTESTIGDTLQAGVLALVLALVANAAVTALARMGDIGEGLQAMQYPSVIVLTAVGVVGATIVYVALARLTSRPDRTFVIVAAVVLIVSVVPDVTVIPNQPGGSMTAGAVLASMHVIAAGITVWLLVDWDQVR